MRKLLVLTATLVITACSVFPQKQTAEQNRKELDDALKEVEVPTMEKTLYDSGEAALKAGDSMKAEYYFDQLVKKDPKNNLYKFKYAEALRKRNACKDANTLYEDVLKDKPADLDASEGRALCLVNLGEFEKASPILTDIIQKDSSRWKSINAAGLIFAINKKFKEANQYLDLAADTSNHNPAVLNNQALVKALMGNYEDAVKILKEASTRASDNLDQKRKIDLNLAMVYGISKNMDMAESTAKPWLTQPQLYNNMGIYAELAKDPELARTYLNKALMGTPVYYNKAWENLDKLNSGVVKTNSTPASKPAPGKPAAKTVKAPAKKNSDKNDN